MRNSNSTSSATPQSIELPTYPEATRPWLLSHSDALPNPSEQATPYPSPQPPATSSHDTSHSQPILPRFRKWWLATVHVTLPRDADFRDFLGAHPDPLTRKQMRFFNSNNSTCTALERTFLAFTRTALALAMLSVLVAQLYILTDYNATFPDGQGPRTNGLSFEELGKPLSVSLVGGSIIVASVGGVRYMRQQSAILNGKVYSGGMDFLVIFALSVGVSLFGPLEDCGRKLGEG
jgi:uncharacterized membrane protein YidH (DUF202 family)